MGDFSRWEGMSKFWQVGGGFPHHPEGKTLYFVCSYHFTRAFLSESILYSCLNVKELSNFFLKIGAISKV